MTLVKNPATGLAPTLARFFDDFLTRDWFDWSTNHFSATNTTIPAVNILETNDSFEVEMAAPGMRKEDFHIELRDNVLTIRSERKNEQELKDGDRYVRREFSYQSFQRTFELQKDVVDIDKIQANYRDGILHLSIPKTAEARSKAPRKINIA